MKVELTSHEIDVVLFDLSKLIEYYTDLLERPEELAAEYSLADDDETDDETEGAGPAILRAMTEAHIADLKNVKKKLTRAAR